MHAYRLNEMLQTQLDGQGRLANTTVSQHHQFVQHHSARHDGRKLVVEQPS